jgi:hypothetical protein
MVLRQAMKGILPEPIRSRKDKAEFSCMINLDLKELQSHKVREILQKSTLATFGIIYSNKLQRLFEDYQKGIVIGNAVRNTLEIVIWLELWCRSALSNIKGGDKDGRTK